MTGKILSLLVCTILLSSCASRPVLYPNEKYKQVGKKRAESDIDMCVDRADRFVKSKKGKKILKSAGKGALIGGAMGAVLGIVTGDIMQAAAIGAGAAAVGGATSAAISPDELKKRYSEYCLRKRNYQILGWD